MHLSYVYVKCFDTVYRAKLHLISLPHFNSEKRGSILSFWHFCSIWLGKVANILMIYKNFTFVKFENVRPFWSVASSDHVNISGVA